MAVDSAMDNHENEIPTNVDEITSYLTKFGETLGKLIAELEELIQEKGIGKFLAEDESWVVGNCFGLWLELVQSLEVSSYDELRGRLVQLSNSGHPDVQLGMDKFYEAEQNWHALIASMEARFQYVERMKIGHGHGHGLGLPNSTMDGDHTDMKSITLQKLDKKTTAEIYISLADICKGVRYTWVIFTRHLSWPACKAYTVAAAEIRKTLKEISCQVVVVHFGSRKRAGEWRSEIKCPFQQYLDQSRSLYRALGMGRSVEKTWCLGSVKYVVNHIMAGHHVEFAHDEFDDSIQLGGDAIFDSGGHPIWKRLGENAADRPEAQSMLEYLADLEGQRLAKCGCIKPKII